MIRVCKKCNKEKDLSLFTNNKLCLYGKEHRCKSCTIKSSADYSKNNQECVKEYKKKWHLKQPKKPSINSSSGKLYISKLNNRKKSIAKLSDRYIKQRLIYNRNIKVLETFEISQEMIELKRKQLLLKRKIRNNDKN